MLKESGLEGIQCKLQAIMHFFHSFFRERSNFFLDTILIDRLNWLTLTTHFLGKIVQSNSEWMEDCNPDLPGNSTLKKIASESFFTTNNGQPTTDSYNKAPDFLICTLAIGSKKNPTATPIM